MARHASTSPTEQELDILKILWQEGECTVRQIKDILAGELKTLPPGVEARDLALTTVTTILKVVVEKGYVERRKVSSRYTYIPLLQEGDNATSMTQNLLKRIYNGSTRALISNLFNSKDLNPEELKEIRDLIDKNIPDEK